MRVRVPCEDIDRHKSKVAFLVADSHPPFDYFKDFVKLNEQEVVRSNIASGMAEFEDGTIVQLVCRPQQALGMRYDYVIYACFAEELKNIRKDMRLEAAIRSCSQNVRYKDRVVWYSIDGLCGLPFLPLYALGESARPQP